ncbi:MAG: hypothetical protein E7080_10440 [Bacteroidales bacterium]|nr:hypothetical protein [Bacteroidales bacterium]
MYISFVSNIVKTNAEGYEHLISLYQDLLKSDDNVVQCNFYNCVDFDANLASVLGVLLDLLVEKGKAVYITRPKGKHVRRCLARNKFLKAFDIETDTEDKERYIQYNKFSTSDSTDFKEYIKIGLIDKQKFPMHTEQAGKYIVENIFEIFANATTHGDCEYVYCCGEYKDNCNPPVLDMTIVDCGNTIYKNVNTFLRNRQNFSPCEAIRWALKEGNTTKSNTGGLGLAQIESFIRQNKGELQIVSDRGMCELKNGVWNDITLENRFPGTIVNMKFNFEDTKLYYLKTEVDFNNLL